MCGAGRKKHLATRTLVGKRYRLARCLACGQHYTDPLPAADEIGSFYQGVYHEERRGDDGGEKLYGKRFAAFRDWILKFVKGGRSVDIGTSTGLFPYLLKQAGFDAEGVEYFAESAQWGSAHYGIRIRIGGAEVIAQEPETYDLITMTDVIEHTQNPLLTLKAVSRSLKPGGHMLITFPDIQSLESRYEQAIARAAGWDWFWTMCRTPIHVWEFTPQTARRMFEKGGLQVVGFRRSQAQWPKDKLPGIAGLLATPLNALRIPPVGRVLGNQLEFMLQRNC